MAKSTLIAATPNTGWEFKNWTENGVVISTESEFMLEVSKDTHLIANFQKKTYLVEVLAEGSGTVSGDGSYLYGSEVKLTATPSENFKFIGWFNGEELVSESKDYLFTISDNVNLTAKFEEIFFNVTLEAKPIEGGSVSGGGLI